MTRALLVDYGGVLTPPVAPAFEHFERSHGMPHGSLHGMLLAAYQEGADDGLVTRIELGQIEPEEFEVALAAMFAEGGYEVSASGLIERIFGGLSADDDGIWDVVGAARDQGVATALLSNSWGTSVYPRDRLAAVFDAQVISCEVGLRKPDPAIYRLTARELGVDPTACAFVDDLERNVEVARSLGMHGVLHRGDVAETAAALEPFLGVTLTGAAG